MLCREMQTTNIYILVRYGAVSAVAVKFCGLMECDAL